MKALSSTIAAGVIIGAFDAAILIQAATSGQELSIGLVVLAIAHAVLLTLPIAGVAALLKRIGDRARLGGFVALLLPWLLVVYSLSGGHGISASRWRIPFGVGASLIGAVALYIAVKLAALMLRQGKRKHALLLVFLSSACGLYACGFLYPQSYEWLHLYLLLLAACALAVAIAGQNAAPRRFYFATLTAVLSIGAAFLVPNTGARKALLVQHAQGAGSLAFLQSALGHRDSENERLRKALRDGSMQIKARIRMAPCTDEAPAAHDVILLTVDALRADRLFSTGPRPVTPSLDALARTGSSFTSAYAPSPATSTSLVSILSGNSALALREFDELPKTLATELGALGYSTVSFHSFSTVTRRLLPAAHASKLGFAELRKERKANEVISSIVESISKTERKPLFFYAHLPEPHAPYQKQAGFDFGTTMVGRYDSEVAFVDAQIGRLVAEIERLGRSSSTIIAVSADHGEAFFEHGVAAHGTTLYEEMIRVPLVLRIPGIRSEPSPSPVSLLDLAPTLLAGVGCGWSTHTEGQSLLRDGAIGTNRAPVVVRQYDTSAAEEDFVRRVASRIGDHKLILDLQTGVAELFDLSLDPGEDKNLIDRRPAVREELRQSLVESSHFIGSLIAQNTASALGSIAAAIDGGELDALDKAIEALAELKDDTPQAIDLIRALEGSSHPKALGLLEDLSQDAALPPRIAEAITLALARRGNLFAKARILRWFGQRDASETARLDALQILRAIPMPGLSALLRRTAASEPNLPLAISAAITLCQRPGSEKLAARLIRKRASSVEALVEFESTRLRGMLECLARAGDEEDVDYLVRAHVEGVVFKKSLAYESMALLGQTHSDKALPALLKESKVGYEPVRLAALEALAELGTPAAIAALSSMALTNKHLRQAPAHFAALLRDRATVRPITLPPLDSSDFFAELELEIQRALTHAQGRNHLLLVYLSAANQALVLELHNGTSVRISPGDSGDPKTLPVFVSVEAGHSRPTFSMAPKDMGSLRSAELLSF